MGTALLGQRKKRCMVNCFSSENCCHKVLSAIEGFFIVKPPVSVYAIASNFSFSFRSQLHCNKSFEVEICFLSRITDNEALKSICRLLGLRANNPTLGVQHAICLHHIIISVCFLILQKVVKITQPLMQFRHKITPFASTSFGD